MNFVTGVSNFCIFFLFTVSAPTEVYAVRGYLSQVTLDGRKLFCGSQIARFNDDDHVAALASSRFTGKHWSDDPLCYTTLNVTGPTGTVFPKVLDRCENCEHNDIAVTPRLFEEIANGYFPEVMVPVEWRLLEDY